MHQDRLLEPGLGLELREEAIHVVDVPGALDLRHHDHVELVADLGDQRGEVVEHPGALEAVDARPELRVAEVDLLAHGDEALASGLLVVDRHGVLEVAQKDVGLLGDVGQLGPHLLVGGVEEMDHPRGDERDLLDGVRSSDGERQPELAGVSQVVSLGQAPAVSPDSVSARKAMCTPITIRRPKQDGLDLPGLDAQVRRGDDGGEDGQQDDRHVHDDRDDPEDRGSPGPDAIGGEVEEDLQEAQGAGDAERDSPQQPQVAVDRAQHGHDSRDQEEESDAVRVAAAARVTRAVLVLELHDHEPEAQEGEGDPGDLFVELVDLRAHGNDVHVAHYLESRLR